ncbi:MAG: glycosyltransferase family 4 protein [Candidatus Thermoplasmatota archaeon]
MRINAFYYRLDHLRGGALAFLNTMCGLAKKHSIHIYTLSISEEFLSKFNEKNIKVTKVDIKCSGNAIIRNIQTFKINKYAKKIAEQMSDCDLVYINGFQLSSYLIPHIRNKIIFYLDEPDRGLYELRIFFKYKPLREKIGAIIDYPFSFIDHMRYKNAYKIPKVIIANSKYSKSYMHKCYGDNLNIKVLYLGVDTNIFKPMNKDRNIILSVGALNFAKCHDFVIRSLSLIEDCPKLIIVGSGKEENNLLKIANKLNVDVEIKKDVSFNELSLLYNQAILTAIAYLNEPFGLTAIESMACSTPVVAVKEGGLCESIIDGKTGFSVERDEKKFATTIKKLLEDRELAIKMGEEGYKRVIENFTWEKTIKNLDEIIENV